MTNTQQPRVLAIHAHPDDIEILCAGALIRLKALGCHIEFATMTPGDKGSAELGGEEIAAVRRKEARKSADILGVPYHCLEFRDLEIEVTHKSKQRVSELLRRVRPDIVITAPPVDYMSDHEATCQIVRDSCFNAAVPNYVTEQWDPAPVLEHIPHLYYVDPIEGVDWFGNLVPPDFIVDVSSEMEQKLEMLACHESQRAWLRRQHGMDEYLDSCRRWGAARGESIGTAYGEGFRKHAGHPYPHGNPLKDLLCGG
ncbi:MAG: PIG-L family deacetylase [Planctomycetaceae bacterium]|nr:PIG-L family deacetylase [Planctomycetaceae bacterium]MCB9949414.1 PIG-L family deacetylase [Planctomycetaceae bacterium]